jgi:lysophospholipase L1-like esterase
MRRNGFLLAAGVFGASFLAACGHGARTTTATQAAGDAQPLDIVVLGDSLALGIGASTPTGGFAWRVYEALARTHPGSRIANFAIGGTTAADVYRLEAERLAHRRADIVLLCVGGNDVLRRVSTGSFARNYTRLAGRIRELQPHALLVFCGVPDVALSPIFASTETSGVERVTKTNDAAVRRIAAANGAVFFDLYAVTHKERGRTAAFLSADQFHPSDAGHALIASALIPMVEGTLAKR